MLRAIREIQPRWVVGENVRGLTNWNGGMVFDEVQADLEAEGYEVLPFLLPACAVDAPHRRDRIWFVAYRNEKASNERSGQQWEQHKPSGQTLREVNLSGSEDVANGTNARFKSVQQSRENGLYGFEFTTNASEERREGSEQHGTFDKGNGREQSSISVAKFYKIGDWQQFPTESPLCSRNDGVPAGLDGITFPKWRKVSIRAYGNAIVPQVAYQIFQAIQQMEHGQQTQ